MQVRFFKVKTLLNNAFNMFDCILSVNVKYLIEYRWLYYFITHFIAQTSKFYMPLSIMLYAKQYV